MSDRWTTALGALFALVIMIALLYKPAQSLPVSRPTSVEHGVNGYLGLQRWLQQAGLQTVALRQRWDGIGSDPRLSPRGNVLITTAPYVNAPRDSEIAALHEWIAAGNTVLMLAALNDSPSWLNATPTTDLLAELEAITGLSFDVAIDDEGEPVFIGDVLQTTTQGYSPVFQHPLMVGVDKLQSISDSVTNLWYPDVWNSNVFALRLAVVDDYALDALWQLPQGEGQIILSASSTVLTNRMLGEASNARFMANVLAGHLGAQGVVIFDDFHQGLTDLYDPDAFFGDPRLHNSLWFILVFWFLYLLGSSHRLVPVRDTPVQSSEIELVQAMGGFMSRKLSRAEAGRQMVLQWLQSLQRAGHIIGSTTPSAWEQLQAMPLIDTVVLAEVRDSYSRLGRGEKVDLKALHNKLLILKRNLA